MARLENKNYKSIQKSELNNPVVFVVDMIKGFVNIGPLHDEAIGNVEKKYWKSINMFRVQQCFCV